MSSTLRGPNYINQVRTAANKLWESINDLVALQREWNAMDYTNTLANGVAGTANEGVTKTEVGAVVFDTANAFVTTLGSGHATNISKLL